MTYKPGDVPSKLDLIELYNQCPEWAAWFNNFMASKVTYEEALMGTVLYLFSKNQMLEVKIREILTTHVPLNLVVKKDSLG